MGSDQWRLLFAIGVLPALLVLLVRLWVPESPRWLCRQGRYEEARKSLAWALQMEPSALPLPTAADAGPIIKTSWFDLFKYPRSLLVSWLGNAGAQTGVYGITLWAPSLFVLLLKVTPQQAAKMMILLSIFGFLGRVSFSFLSTLRVMPTYNPAFSTPGIDSAKAPSTIGRSAIPTRYGDCDATTTRMRSPSSASNSVPKTVRSYQGSSPPPDTT